MQRLRSIRRCRWPQRRGRRGPRCRPRMPPLTKRREGIRRDCVNFVIPQGNLHSLRHRAELSDRKVCCLALKNHLVTVGVISDVPTKPSYVGRHERSGFAVNVTLGLIKDFSTNLGGSPGMEVRSKRLVVRPFVSTKTSAPPSTHQLFSYG